MGRYVDIDDVINLFGISDSDIDAKGTIEDALYDGSLPLADVAPVRHAYMLTDEEGNIKCSNCGSCECWGNYCMNCGARMDEVEE